MSYEVIERCRVCGSSELVEILKLGEQALTGVFPKTGEAESCDTGPVTLVKCASGDGCGLVQMKETYSLAQMYGPTYGYRTGLNASMVNHIEAAMRGIAEAYPPKEGNLVVDIGSNDGTGLNSYSSNQSIVVGVDPSGAKFKEYYNPNITLIPDFFTFNAVNEKFPGKKASIITSFSMFYDLPAPIEFAENIKQLLDTDGVWIFEQSYMPRMIEQNSFDTICQEHLEYYALYQIEYILKHAGLKVIDLSFNDVNGGSFRVTATHKESSLSVTTDLIKETRSSELEIGIHSLDYYREFASRVDAVKIQVREFLDECKVQGKRVYGLGASTKGNVLLQYYGIDRSDLIAIGEVNPDKYGCVTPGSNIPIIPESEVFELKPDYLFVLPWHFRSFFENTEAFKGQRLVFPLPNLSVVET